MRRIAFICLAPIIIILAIFSSPTAASLGAPAHTKKQAEVNVLRYVARAWGPNRLPTLIDSRNHLLATNTEAICHGRGKPQSRYRYTRFVCVVRPKSHRAGEGLYVSYRALRNGRFKIRWLAYRR